MSKLTVAKINKQLSLVSTRCDLAVLSSAPLPQRFVLNLTTYSMELTPS